MSRAWIIGFCCFTLSVATAACGEPRSGNDGFEFEPVPLTTIADGTLVLALERECGSVLPDLINALVSLDGYASFKGWVTDVGFKITEEQETKRGFIVVIRVPVGSPPAAVEAVLAQPGVISSSLYSIGLGERPCGTL